MPPAPGGAICAKSRGNIPTRYRSYPERWVVIPMISVIIAPPSTWRPPAALILKPPPPKLERLDSELVETLRRHGCYGSLIWPLLKQVADNKKSPKPGLPPPMPSRLGHRNLCWKNAEVTAVSID